MLLSSPLPLSTSFWWRFVDRICWFVFICEKWIANLVGCCNVWERFVRLRIGCHKSVKCNLGIYRWRFHSICTVLMCVCVCASVQCTRVLCVKRPKTTATAVVHPPHEMQLNKRKLLTATLLKRWLLIGDDNLTQSFECERDRDEQWNYARHRH